ncbi:MAG: T9SS type A sorting domain-containing protein [Bacteroidetes bacterium]|nr:T9SS type A sorting domain-containing protein [Bacteroidota bacterium]
MRQLLLCLTAFLILTTVYGQTTFQKTYGGAKNDQGYSVQQTSDGGYIMVGRFQNSNFTGDVYLIKTTTNGDTLWTKTFGGVGNDDGSSVLQTTDGGYIIAGTTMSFSPGNGEDIYLIKTNSIGDTLWTKILGGVADDVGSSILQTSDGGFIIAGSTMNFSAGWEDVYLIKTDGNANIVWGKSFGGINGDVASSVQQTTDGGYIIVGNTQSFGAGSYDVYLIRSDASGNSLWTKTFGGSGMDFGYSVQQTTDGGYIIAGGTYSFGAGGEDVYLIKTDGNGDTLWTKTLGGISSDVGSAVQQTSDGGFVIAGSTSSFSAGSNDVYLIKTDGNGNSLWGKSFGGTGSDWSSQIQQTSDGGYVISGSTWSFDPFFDIYLIKCDSNGNSGCNEGNTNTITKATTTTVTNPATQVSSGGIAKNPPTQTGTGGAVTTLCFANGVNEIEQKNIISIYPNPFSTQTTLQTDKFFKNATLTVYNLYGQTVKQIDNLAGQTIIFHRDNLRSGLYFIRITQDNKIITADKLVITDN